jgi:hypothetical protein
MNEAFAFLCREIGMSQQALVNSNRREHANDLQHAMANYAKERDRIQTGNSRDAALLCIYGLCCEAFQNLKGSEDYISDFKKRLIAVEKQLGIVQLTEAT